MKALYQTARKDSIRKFDRIVCNNNPYKWFDITEILKKSSNKLRLFIRKYNYNINFELVVIDEKVAFIHFYQTSKSGDVDDSLKSGCEESRHDSQKQRIKSTLKITGKAICMELAKIFDRLHHREFNAHNPNDLSRTLLGVTSIGNLTEKEKNSAYFKPSQTISANPDTRTLNILSDNNKENFIKALSE